MEVIMILLKYRYLRLLLALLFVGGSCTHIIARTHNSRSYRRSGFGIAYRKYAAKRSILQNAAKQRTVLKKLQPQQPIAQKQQYQHDTFETNLLHRAYALAHYIKLENDQTTKVKIDSITFEIGNSNKFTSSPEGSIYGIANIKCDNHGNGKKVEIMLNSALKHQSVAVQTQVILHELAHSYDIHLWNSIIGPNKRDALFDAYPYLQKDVEYCKTQLKPLAQQMIAHEWYAQWKSMKWMMKYAPNEVETLKRDYKNLAAYQSRTGITSVQYPPAALLLQWLA